MSSIYEGDKWATAHVGGRSVISSRLPILRSNIASITTMMVCLTAVLVTLLPLVMHRFEYPLGMLLHEEKPHAIGGLIRRRAPADLSAVLPFKIG